MPGTGARESQGRTPRILARVEWGAAALSALLLAAATAAIKELERKRDDAQNRIKAALEQLAKDQKRIVVFNMHGGLSQLESWDPKPGTATGGPFRAIPTSVPGIHISELLPHTARVMHHLALIRGINTNI